MASTHGQGKHTRVPLLIRIANSSPAAAAAAANEDGRNRSDGRPPENSENWGDSERNRRRKTRPKISHDTLSGVSAGDARVAAQVRWPLGIDKRREASLGCR